MSLCGCLCAITSNKAITSLCAITSNKLSLYSSPSKPLLLYLSFYTSFSAGLSFCRTLFSWESVCLDVRSYATALERVCVCVFVSLKSVANSSHSTYSCVCVCVCVRACVCARTCVFERVYMCVCVYVSTKSAANSSQRT